ncbi:hypothetical protein D3C85_293140 [compost metagenome]
MTNEEILNKAYELSLCIDFWSGTIKDPDDNDWYWQAPGWDAFVEVFKEVVEFRMNVQEDE